MTTTEDTIEAFVDTMNTIEGENIGHSLVCDITLVERFIDNLKPFGDNINAVDDRITITVILRGLTFTAFLLGFLFLLIVGTYIITGGISFSSGENLFLENPLLSPSQEEVRERLGNIMVPLLYGGLALLLGGTGLILFLNNNEHRIEY